MTKNLKIGMGTLENLILGRTKGVSAELASAIGQLWITTIETEIRRLEHELQTARQIGTRLDDASIQSIQAHLESAKELLRGG